MSEPPELPGMTHRWADAGGVRVHYGEAGDPDGAPLLLLHGWPQHHGLWAPIVGRLAARGLRLIVPDLRGLGWSEAPGDGYDCDTFARDQVALLDALGIERAGVLGHDWGGWTAFLLGLDHAERVGRLMVLNAPHPWPRRRPALLLEAWRSWYAVANALPGIGPRVAPRTARAVLRQGNVGDPFSGEQVERYAELFDDRARAAATVGIYRYYLRVFGASLRGRFAEKRLAAPTLLLFGAQDRWVSAKLLASRGLERRAPEMEIELVPDSGHFIVDEKPDLVAERALAHFAA